MQAMHQSSEAPPESALPAEATTSSAETPRPMGRAWIIVGVVALIVGLAMGFIMSSLSS